MTTTIRTKDEKESIAKTVTNDELLRLYRVYFAKGYWNLTQDDRETYQIIDDEIIARMEKGQNS